MSDAVRATAVTQSEGCLHLVLRPQAALLESCLASCARNDAVVLMDAAVMLLAGPCPDPAVHIELCCLEADVRARGLQNLVPTLPWIMISEYELVERAARYRHCLSWK